MRVTALHEFPQTQVCSLRAMIDVLLFQFFIKTLYHSEDDIKMPTNDFSKCFVFLLQLISPEHALFLLVLGIWSGKKG